MMAIAKDSTAANNNGTANSKDQKNSASSDTAPPTAAQPTPENSVKPVAQKPDTSPLPEGENLDKIREILFGRQVQTHDHRFEQLEQRLAKESTSLRADFNQQMNALEDRIVSRINTLTQRLQAEETARKDAYIKLTQTLSESERAAERRTTRLDEKIETLVRDLQADMKHQTLTLKDTLEQQIYETLSVLEKEIEDRKYSAETERNKLSSLYGDLSKQLREEA